MPQYTVCVPGMCQRMPRCNFVLNCSPEDLVNVAVKTSIFTQVLVGRFAKRLRSFFGAESQHYRLVSRAQGHSQDPASPSCGQAVTCNPTF